MSARRPIRKTATLNGSLGQLSRQTKHDQLWKNFSPPDEIMPLSKKEISRRVWQCVNACEHKHDSDEEKLFMDALTNSDTLSKQLSRAKLSRQEVEGFISTTLTLNLDYLLLQSRLNGAKRYQSIVKKKAADLAHALMKLSTHSFPSSTAHP